MARQTAPSLEQIRAGAVLEPGMSGPSASELQTKLTKLGFITPVTGTHDVGSQAALRLFQCKYDVQQNGRLGPTTIAVLDKAMRCSVTLAQFTQISGLDKAAAAVELQGLNASMYQADISTVQRKATYLAQLGHESMGFKQFEELASGSAYEGRRDLGNTERGDGKRYKGRGAIQVTGRANYREATSDLGPQLGGTDLEQNPERGDDPDVRYMTAAWFWNKRNLNKHADAGKFDTVTSRINGGQNGRPDRRARHAKALKVLQAG
jgi:predicted chitinase